MLTGEMLGEANRVLACSDMAVVIDRGQIIDPERASTRRTPPEGLQRLIGVE